MSVKGYLDKITENSVSGWAMDETKQESIKVRLIVDEKVVVSTMADIYRGDVLEAGIHSTGNCGFYLQIDDFNLLEHVSTVKVVCGDQNTELEKTRFLSGNLLKENRCQEGVNSGDDRFFYIHIPKTAGTSFRVMLYDLFHQREIYPNSHELDQSPEYQVYFDLDRLFCLSDKMSMIKLLVGHFPFSSGSVFGQTPKYLVFLRNPIDRTLSHLFHIKRTIPEYQNKDLEYIVESEINQITNVQVSFLGYDLESAKSNLSKCSFIGLTDEFDTSILLCEKIFGWNFKKLHKKNVRSKNDKTLISPKILEKISECNRQDDSLYKHGKNIFQKLLSANGISEKK